MKLVAKIINALLIVVLLAGMIVGGFTRHLDKVPQSGASFALLLLFSASLYYLLKGGGNKLRISLIVANTIFGLLLYIPPILLMMGSSGSIPLWMPFATILVFIPFAFNVLALLKPKSQIATVPIGEG
jgi:hypothetical protein